MITAYFIKCYVTVFLNSTLNTGDSSLYLLESLLKRKGIKNWIKRKITSYANPNYLRVGMNYSSLFILYVAKIA